MRFFSEGFILRGLGWRDSRIFSLIHGGTRLVFRWTMLSLCGRFGAPLRGRLSLLRGLYRVRMRLPL